MIALRKRHIVIAVIAVLVMLVMAVPAMAGELILDEKVYPVCENPDGTVKVDVTNYGYEAGAFFEACTSEVDCVEVGWLDYGASTSVDVPAGTCVVILAASCNPVQAEFISGPALACQIGEYEPFDSYCTELGWPACPVEPTCDGGAGLYPPSNSGVPYNGYNDFGNFILAVDNHCDQPVEWVDMFIGDPLSEVMQVMSLPVDSNGWTQFNQDDIMNVRDMYSYEGEIWFRVRGIGDRYYGLHELMTHPNLGSGD